MVSDPGNGRRLDLPLIGAAQRTGDITPYPETFLQRPVHHILIALNTLIDTAIDIPAGEAFRGGGKDGDLFHARIERGLQAPAVGNQHRVADAVQRLHAT